MYAPVHNFCIVSIYSLGRIRSSEAAMGGEARSAPLVRQWAQKTGARSAWVRTRGQNPLVINSKDAVPVGTESRSVIHSYGPESVIQRHGFGFVSRSPIRSLHRIPVLALLHMKIKQTLLVEHHFSHLKHLVHKHGHIDNFGNFYLVTRLRIGLSISLCSHP